jgi:hypothetical protein
MNTIKMELEYKPELRSALTGMLVPDTRAEVARTYSAEDIHDAKYIGSDNETGDVVLLLECGFYAVLYGIDLD